MFYNILKRLLFELLSNNLIKKQYINKYRIKLLNVLEKIYRKIYFVNKIIYRSQIEIDNKYIEIINNLRQ